VQLAHCEPGPLEPTALRRSGIDYTAGISPVRCAGWIGLAPMRCVVVGADRRLRLARLMREGILG